MWSNVIYLRNDYYKSLEGTEPAVFMECKSIGLKKDQTAELSSVLCLFCKEELNVPGDRVYIQFVSVEGALWGWDSRTF